MKCRAQGFADWVFGGEWGSEHTHFDRASMAKISC